jgi:hypothetical protein
VLVVVPLAAALAVGAAFVHGFVSSGSNRADAAALGPAVVHSTARSAHVFGRDATGGVPAATQSNKQLAVPGTNRDYPYALNQSTFRAASGSAVTQGAPLKTAHESLVIPKNRLVHAVASLQVGVTSKDLSAKTNAATQIVGSFGGYAQSVRYQADHQGNGESVLSLRVPVQNAQKAITKLGSLGTVLSEQVSTQDLQAKVTHQTSAIGSLRRAITVYEAALQSTTSATQRAELQIKLNNARRALARLRHARAGTVAQAANADISLLLTTNGHAVVAPGHHGSTRIGRLLGSAAHFLALEGIIVLYAIIVLAPLLLIAGLVWWVLRERRRREERLLSTA